MTNLTAFVNTVQFGSLRHSHEQVLLSLIVNEKLKTFHVTEMYQRRTYKGSSRSRVGPEKEPILNGPSKSKKEETNPKQIGKLSNVKIVTRTFRKGFISDSFLVLMARRFYK